MNTLSKGTVKVGALVVTDDAVVAGDATVTGAMAAASFAAPNDPAQLQYADVTLTNAQMLALRATPIALVAAPGEGTVLEFVGALLKFDVTTAGYTETADNLAVRYENGTGVIVSQAIESTGFLDQTTDGISNAPPKIDAIGLAVNKALVLHNPGDGELTGGNAANTLKVRTLYRVHTL